MSNYISKYLNFIREQYLYINTCNILQIYLYPQRYNPRVTELWAHGLQGLQGYTTPGL